MGRSPHWPRVPPLDTIRRMACTLKVTVRYDGTNFVGWQIQPNGPSVQAAIEAAMSRIAHGPIRIHGAGRTDSGVHALGQVFSCRWPLPDRPAVLQKALCSLLRPDISIVSIETVPDDFHAAFSSTGKRYAYVIGRATFPDPFSRRYAWHIQWPIEPGRVEDLAQRLVGKRDFAGFRSAGHGSKTSVRTIHSIAVREGGVTGPIDAPGLFRIEFTGSGFLYRMVRNITGTLIDAARGHIPESTIDERLAAPGPYSGYSAPARGLFMMEVRY